MTAGIEKIREIDEKIDQARDATHEALEKIVKPLEDEAAHAIAQLDAISKLDGIIDEKRQATDEFMEKLIDSLVNEMKEAAQVFNTTRERSTWPRQSS